MERLIVWRWWQPKRRTTSYYVSRRQTTLQKRQRQRQWEKLWEDWGLKESIIACGFDTTSSNTGIHKGSCVLLQDILQRQLLWLACRHHIMELLVKAAYHQVFGDSKSSDVKLFSIMKDPSTWNSLNLVDFRLPTIPQAYKNNVDSLLSFINKQLDEENAAEIPRGDYKEFLMLAKIFLGGSIDRKNGYTFQLSRPGADHHARWISKCIYFLKLSLLSHQFLQSQLSWQQKKKVETMAFFIVFPYLESWFCSPSLLGAAENDLKLFKRLQKFSKINKKTSSATSTVLCRNRPDIRMNPDPAGYPASISGSGSGFKNFAGFFAGYSIFKIFFVTF